MEFTVAGAADPAHCFVLGEATLFRFLSACLRRQPVYVIAIATLVRGLEPAFEALFAWARRKGLAHPLEDISPDLTWVEGMPGRGWYHDIHARTEDAVNAALPWNTPPPEIADLAYMMRKAVSDLTQNCAPVLLFHDWAVSNLRPGSWRLHAASAHLGLLYRAYHGRELPGTGPARFHAAWNLLNTLVAWSATTAWLAGRIRPQVEIRPNFMGIDLISPDDRHIVEHLVGDPAKVTVIWRSAPIRAKLADKFQDCPSAMLGDARVKPAKAVRHILRMGWELAALWRRYGRLDPLLFGRLAALVRKRPVFAAFLDTFPVKYLWCRDDYSLDHGVRSVEARRRGIRSLGCTHGQPLQTVAPQWREIDLDIYYVYGSLQTEIGHRSWPPHMSVKAVGNLHLTPERRKRLGAPKPPDIAYFATDMLHVADAVAMVVETARHLPDRTVWVKVKPFRSKVFQDRFGQLMAAAPANVKIYPSTDCPYELMLQCRYVLSTGSTVSVEALQFGCYSYVLDVAPEVTDFVYRRFPGMTVSSASDLLSRIKALENGDADYPHAELEPLIVPAGVDAYAAVRADLFETAPAMVT